MTVSAPSHAPLLFLSPKRWDTRILSDSAQGSPDSPSACHPSIVLPALPLLSRQRARVYHPGLPHVLGCSLKARPCAYASGANSELWEENYEFMAHTWLKGEIECVHVPEVGRPCWPVLKPRERLRAQRPFRIVSCCSLGDLLRTGHATERW